MKTICAVLLGGPECGAQRMLPGPLPSIKIPIVSDVVWIAGSDAPPDVRPVHCYCYVATDEKDSYKRAIYRYVGEQG